MPQKRSYLFDNIKALLIFLTVLAHLLKQNPEFHLDSIGGWIYIMIFSFIMQGFIMVSGFFSNNLDKCRATAVKNFLIPYILMVCAVSLASYFITGKTRGSFFDPSFALWFLFALFVYRLLAKDLVRIPGIIWISLALYLTAGLVPFLTDFMVGGRLCSFLLFFIAGYFLTWEHVEKIRSIKKVYLWFALPLLAGIGLWMAYSGEFELRLVNLELPFEELGVSRIRGVIMRTFMLLYFCAWMTVITGLMTAKKIFISDIGRKTVTVYLLHIWIRYMFKFTGISGTGRIDSYILALVFAVLSVWLFSREPVFKAYNRVIDTIYMPIGFVCRKLRCNNSDT